MRYFFGDTISFLLVLRTAICICYLQLRSFVHQNAAKFN